MFCTEHTGARALARACERFGSRDLHKVKPGRGPADGYEEILDTLGLTLQPPYSYPRAIFIVILELP